MRQLAVLLLLLTILGTSLQQTDNSSPVEDKSSLAEDKKAKKLTDKAESKKRDNKKVGKKMLKAFANETDGVEAESGTMEDSLADPGGDSSPTSGTEAAGGCRGQLYRPRE